MPYNKSKNSDPWMHLQISLNFSNLHANYIGSARFLRKKRSKTLILQIQLNQVINFIIMRESIKSIRI